MHAAALVPFNCAPKLFTVGRCYRRRRGVTWSRISLPIPRGEKEGKFKFEEGKQGGECKNRSPNFHRLSFVSFARNNRDKRVYKFCYDALLLDDAYSLFIIIGHCKFPLYSVIIRPTYILKVKRSLHVHPPIHLLPLEIVTRVKFEDQFSAIKRYPIESEKN